MMSEFCIVAKTPDERVALALVPLAVFCRVMPVGLMAVKSTVSENVRTKVAWLRSRTNAISLGWILSGVNTEAC